MSDSLPPVAPVVDDLPTAVREPRNTLEGDLEFANRQAAEAEILYEQQMALVERLRLRGRDTSEAERWLAKLEDTLTLMRSLQQQLLEEERRASEKRR